VKHVLPILICILIGSGVVVNAQEAFSFQHAALAVENVDSSAEFYMKILGFEEIPNRTQRPGIRWLSLGNGQELHLIQAETDQIRLIKHIHLAWSTPIFKDFLAVLEAHNLEYTDWPGTLKGSAVRADGVRQIYFQDPDGYWIEINDEYK